MKADIVITSWRMCWVCGRYVTVGTGQVLLLGSGIVVGWRVESVLDCVLVDM
jgi:hypothetical protein